MTTEVRDDQGNFVGHEPRRCGVHRTVGERAWCFDCGEWCYPGGACHGCLQSQEFICSECQSYLGTLTSFAPETKVVVGFTCPDCGTVNSWRFPT